VRVKRRPKRRYTTVREKGSEERKLGEKTGIETHLEKKVQTLKAVLQARDGDVTIGQASLDERGSLACVLALI
jgi:hypothetical protein